MLKAGLATVFCLSFMFHSVLAQTSVENEKKVVKETRLARAATQTAFAEKIESLLAMPAKERVAHLKKLAPKERRGLWFQLKKEERARRGVSRKAVGSYQNITPIPVTAQPTEWINRSVPGNIIYDSGFPTTGFGGGELVGNRFNTHTGIPALASGTVQTVQALVVPGPANTTNSAGFVLHGPQTVGGGAMAIFSTFGTANGVIDSLSFTGIGANYTGNSFFVLFGDFASVYIPVFGTGTTKTQGHHGAVGYTGGMGPNITGTGNLGGIFNSFIRAGGNIVPVELMKFEVK